MVMRLHHPNCRSAMRSSTALDIWWSHRVHPMATLLVGIVMPRFRIGISSRLKPEYSLQNRLHILWLFADLNPSLTTSVNSKPSEEPSPNPGRDPSSKDTQTRKPDKRKSAIESDFALVKRSWGVWRDAQLSRRSGHSGWLSTSCFRSSRSSYVVSELSRETKLVRTVRRGFQRSFQYKSKS